MFVLYRIFFRFHQFYTGIEEDEDLIFYFSAYAISFLTFFIFLLFWAFLYKITRLDFLALNKIPLFIVAFAFIFTCVVQFFKHRKKISKEIKKMNRAFILEDILVTVFI
jgi:hypothetical protein